VSTYFAAWCHTCREAGPQIARQPGGVSLQAPVGQVRVGTWPDRLWASFLVKHELHDLRLVHEQHQPPPP
jgi:hypothetical protein